MERKKSSFKEDHFMPKEYSYSKVLIRWLLLCLTLKLGVRNNKVYRAPQQKRIYCTNLLRKLIKKNYFCQYNSKLFKNIINWQNLIQQLSYDELFRAIRQISKSILYLKKFQNKISNGDKSSDFYGHSKCLRLLIRPLLPPNCVMLLL